MRLLEIYDRWTDRMRAAGDWVAPLGIRLLLAYEFWSAGRTKLDVDGVPGWFAGQDIPVPFGLLPAGVNWSMLAWSEVTAALALILGLFTRFFAFMMLIITTVAIVSVHWPESWSGLGQLWEGYSVSRVMDDGEFRGNFRIPFLFLAMILPLLYLGGGKLSLDHLLVSVSDRGDLVHERLGDRLAASLALLFPGIIAVYLIPSWGIVLLVLAALVALSARFR